jgi:hypothetical protein
MKLAHALIAVAMLLPMAAPAADVRAVLAAPRQRIQSADYRVSGRLARVDEKGARTSYGINIKAHGFPGVLRVLVEVTSPAPAQMHILLEMRPNGRNTIQIAHPGDAAPVTLPFEKWSEGPLGAGFSYEDFLEAQYFWLGQTVLPGAKFGARDCDVVKNTPGPADRTHYAEVKTWLDHGIGFPVYAEKKLKESGQVKEYTYFGLRQNGGVWSASQVEVKIRGHAGSTLLIVDRGTPKANLDLKDFSPAQLTHF